MRRPPAAVGPDHGNLRVERDRFVAFAFCAADLLFEIDGARRIVFAAGAAESVVGRPAESLIGEPFLSLVAPGDRAAAEKMLGAIVAGRRLEPITLRLAGLGQPSPQLFAFGYTLPDLDNRVFLSFRIAGAAAPRAGRNQRSENGMLDSKSFADTAVERMKAAAESGRETQMALIDLGEMEELHARLGADAQAELDGAIHHHLMASSVDGDSVSELGPGRFGLVQEKNVDLGDVQARIEDTARAADPEGVGVTVRSASVNLDCAGLSEADAARALVYTIDNFSRGGDTELTIKELSNGLAGMMESAGRKLATVRSVIENGSFDVAYQPIVALKDRKISHHEALVRAHLDGTDISAPDFILFAEQVGLIAEFDLVMCERVIGTLEKALARGLPQTIAINLSGRSLDTESFRQDLTALLERHEEIRPMLMIEITESMALSDLAATNEYIATLREAGHRVCLDDFGVGANAFEYLRALDIDIVKIDGSYVREALSTPKGRHFLTAMAELCNGLDIVTVAEMVEDEDTAKFLAECGVSYGQGYLFGRPMAESSTKKPRVARRRGAAADATARS